MKYVSSLTGDETVRLQDILKNSPSSRIRTRAHCIILSGKGFSVNQIADISDADRRTVSSWIDSWEESGSVGLADSPRSGRPPKLTGDEKETAKKLTGKYPRSVRMVREQLYEITGKTVSTKTLKRLAGSAGLKWKRIRKSVRSKRNVQEFAQAEEEIRELEKRQRSGEINLYYCDQTGFDLQPTVPYAWQPIGETIGIPSFRSSRLNVAGFLNTADNDFHSFMFECPVNTDIAVACFDRFSETVTGKTTVIIDNASIHTSCGFVENIPKWEERGLSVKYLPPYSPELNLIEILRRFIKYRWLPFSACTSFRNPVNEVENILKGIGSEYRINFS